MVYAYLKDRYKKFSLCACSLGAYFSLLAYQDIAFERCLFISPILNMERLIKNMMVWANVSENELKKKGTIGTSFGETLSWDYYQYVRENPIRKWDSKTFILYGERDNLTERQVLDSFSKKYSCDVTVMENGEHYFHTPEQLAYLDRWIKSAVCRTEKGR
ncbi:alpha/beta hydrolase [Breznakiella homolactica]|uniref:Alpha/beta hydrolase n=1 Tax=Breznakiella homolactica TaxID=2798577 RepID=A0A7T7XS16_9SPIR|nr:alpha/beta hydrolase [Breznakiella homolactica]